MFPSKNKKIKNFHNVELQTSILYYDDVNNIVTSSPCNIVCSCNIVLSLHVIGFQNLLLEMTEEFMFVLIKPFWLLKPMVPLLGLFMLIISVTLAWPLFMVVLERWVSHFLFKFNFKYCVWFLTCVSDEHQHDNDTWLLILGF